jgi:hypothetical protein
MKSDKIINGSCWVAYFDILGFKNEIRLYTSKLDTFVEVQYGEIINYIDVDIKRETDLILKKRTEFIAQKYDCSWFSDSFLFYSSDDSIDSYLTIHLVATSFFHYMTIDKKWPLRGALTVGNFYADKNKNIYLGEAIIVAHSYTEKQDWIGLVLTPNARTKLEKDGHDLFVFANGLGYREYDVPIKRKIFTDGIERIELGHEKLLAYQYRVGDCSRDLFVNWMKSECQHKDGQKAEYKRKYENTLRFYEEKS